MSATKWAEVIYHATRLQKYCECPQAFVFSELDDVKPEFRSAQALSGNVQHRVVAEFLTTGYVNDYEDIWVEEKRNPDKVAEVVLPVKYPYGHDERSWVAQEAGFMFQWFPWFEEYLSSVGAEVLEVVVDGKQVPTVEIPFSLSWRTSAKAPYLFEGTIDAIIEHTAGDHAGIVEQFDLKTGKSLPDDYELKRLCQWMLYPHGAISLGIRPDRFSWVHVRDWIPYKRKTTVKKPRPNKAWVEWRGELPPGTDGACAFRAGSSRGPGVYPVAVTDEYLEFSRQQLIRICASIRMRNFFVGVGKYGCASCDYREPCEALFEPSLGSASQERRAMALAEELGLTG